MKFELMLFALVGLFCPSTHAMPTGTVNATTQTVTEGSHTEDNQSGFESASNDPVEATKEYYVPAQSNITDPAPVYKTETQTMETDEQLMNTSATIVAKTEASTSNTVTAEVTDEQLTSTEPPMKETTADKVVVETSTKYIEIVVTSKEPEINDGTTQVTEAAEEKDTTETEATTDISEETIVQEKNDQNTKMAKEEGDNDSYVMGTGQVVGIVFGALVAVVIIIAIIVVVVKRMGQYSP